MKRYQRERKARALNLLGNRCSRCGTRYDLEFDHINREDKLFTITDNLCRKWDLVVEELAKCQLLCRDHHVEKTRAEGRR